MLLLYLNLKDGNSLGIIGTLRDQFPDVPILVISQFDNIRCAEDALHAGAVGYVMKEEAAQEILTAIRMVPVDRPSSQGSVPAQTAQRPAVALSEGELQVFLLLGSGMPVPEIAAQLKISAETLEIWCKNIKDRLHLPGDAALVDFALKCKSCCDTNGIHPDAALFHCGVQLERCEWGKPHQFKPSQPPVEPEPHARAGRGARARPVRRRVRARGLPGPVAALGGLFQWNCSDVAAPRSATATVHPPVSRANEGR